MDSCAPIQAVTTPPPAGCLRHYTFSVKLHDRFNQEYRQTLSLDPAAEGAKRQLQCDSGPLIYGQIRLMCHDGTWVIENHGTPCFDNQATARVAEIQDRIRGGFEVIPTSIDVTGIVDRLQEQGVHRVKCCCNARLDESLWANWRIHSSWNSRASGHTGFCTVHPGHTPCSHIDSETKGHERTESHRCIVNDADRENWETVLHLNDPPEPRFATPNVPTVSSQEPEEFRDCVPEHSLGECDRCTHSEQCPEDHYCCPFMKLCVADANTECPAENQAFCNGCFERVTPNPEQCSCENPAFPQTWLPRCR